MGRLKYWRWRLGLGLPLLDAFWTASALSGGRGPNLGSTVQMSGLMVWIYLHLPAALLASWCFSSAADSVLVPPTELWLMGALGIVQALLIGWLWGRILDRKR